MTWNVSVAIIATADSRRPAPTLTIAPRYSSGLFPQGLMYLNRCSQPRKELKACPQKKGTSVIF